MSTRITFQLLVTSPAEKHGFYELPAGITLIGRQPTVDLQGEQPGILVLSQQEISRNHAKIECDGRECLLTDLSSRNGTFLGGRRIEPKVPYHLADGAEFKIGDFTLVMKQIVVEVPEPETARTGSGWSSGSGGGQVAQPPGPPETPDNPVAVSSLPGGDEFFKDLFSNSHLLINFLPEIFRDKFMDSFLGLFESILLPVIWNIENFDLYLSYKTAPGFFLPWLAQWFGLVLNDTWKDDQRRKLLKEAHMLFAKRGTPWALGRLLEIYTGKDLYIHQKDHTWTRLDPVWQSFIDGSQADPLADKQHDHFISHEELHSKGYSYIDDTGTKPYHFTVCLRGLRFQKAQEERIKLIEQLIEEHRPAYTSFELKIEE
jgi:phage tail-like protein